ncbi:MAG: MerR family transcriptional regulator [Cytophagales bacterium]|nr:MerR family transcriptional regulator [Cytophaga sp.]
MIQFSIKDLERISGVKAHTIRIWEQRYKIIRPQRSDTNIRSYTHEDLQRILNISVLNNHGMKISRIAKLNDRQIQEEVARIVVQKATSDGGMDALIMSMMDLNGELFEEIIDRFIEQNGFLTTIEQLIYPFFEKLGFLWQTGTVNAAQEHFVSNLIRQKVLVAIDGIRVTPVDGQKSFLLFLPQGEWHEISLLIYSYILRNAGHKVIYIGQNVPYKDIVQICTLANPDVLVTMITNPFTSGTLQEYVHRLSQDFSTKSILISGYQLLIESIGFPDNTIFFKDLNSFKKAL